MNAISAGLGTQLVIAALGILAALAAPHSWRSRLAGSAAALLGAFAVVTGAFALAGRTGSLQLPIPLPLQDSPAAAAVLAPDRLGGLFMIVAGAVGALAAIYGIGYAHGPSASRTGWTSYIVFLLGMQLVPAAGDVISFLLMWEVMAIASTLLVLSDHTHRPQARSAATWYAVMTHASFMFLVAGFAIPAAAARSTSFDDIAHSANLSPLLAGISFVLLTAGFATKAGLVPLHVWLPRAHPEAPSHVSAAMSAAMVKMGIYGIMLTLVRLFPDDHAQWWALVLLAIGLISAVYGILQASVNSDLKRLLAFSTTENVGLMTTAIGVWVLLDQGGAAGSQPRVADIAQIAALMLVVGHAAFKCALFLGAGAILHATGERDLDRLGGLTHRMPFTSAVFGLACLGAASLPVTSGFVAEWTLLQSVIHGDRLSDRVLAVALPLAVGVVALTAGLALLTFVKAYGIAFLARPRSVGSEHAHEVNWPMRLGMLISSVCVVGLGLIPGPLATAVASTVDAGGFRHIGLFGIEFSVAKATLDPMSLCIPAVIFALVIGLIAAVLARRRPRRDVELAWGCGGVRNSPRMEYTATSYAEPLARVFNSTLKLNRKLVVDHAPESDYLVKTATFKQNVTDVIEHRWYLPIRKVLLRLGSLARRLHNGSIHRYLGFSFLALTVVLVVATW